MGIEFGGFCEGQWSTQKIGFEKKSQAKPETYPFRACFASGICRTATEGPQSASPQSPAQAGALKEAKSCFKKKT
ncbi:MAG: hypothetical protein A3H69_00140 [Candidatus Sungbacteria bacterium RIFCSPLOWO2_02_FULL_47_9]|uniref:Uncharacterized protein n=1 Tax=Candidatus Sungbacteria bacterium RIFCSPHIGHO2_01_FULL_47_32 TaxID=1802264 RepID=A0A1G2K4T0_9BACT|nr:MAG: hypothetical protein UX72_C0001G0096 [Parcubacteria group bacterium GW2011_GWA2_47_10]OGZ94416.1 MAG: hypothetical protein A2633_04015 [Candidatus Sungbacteria bacterium RIFCSPHIGHO2_01_FULL_47_32]OGZ98008.1 MAG: hypothetical protein A3D57_02720 [Candidatus Sungbacteria bacterium RIFCSPHIGHO2_02_FULL_46_12]OHA05758.1 MAG: hypothetical protein A3A28_05480 [Candidatus Sungbacteria bacterium RIFCSPLOWO2_01_FULL_47_32]OHA12179.1 MAG: hypothetical protein A3H69_00140 [Candidatus Sungbacteria